MNELGSKLAELVLLERAYTLTRWGNLFDDINKPNDWCAYACKQLFLHPGPDGGYMELMPNRTPDLPFMLALTRVGNVLLSAMDAYDRADHPRRPGTDPMKSNRALIHGILKGGLTQAGFGYTPSVNEWVNHINYSMVKYVGTFNDPDETKEMLRCILADMAVIAELQPEILDQAIAIGKQRFTNATQHPKVAEALRHDHVA